MKKYEKWYGIEHKALQFIDEAVYGLCEINREEIKKARLIAYGMLSYMFHTFYLSADQRRADPSVYDYHCTEVRYFQEQDVERRLRNSVCEVRTRILKADGVASHRHTPRLRISLVMRVAKRC